MLARHQQWIPSAGKEEEDINSTLKHTESQSEAGVLFRDCSRRLTVTHALLGAFIDTTGALIS